MRRIVQLWCLRRYQCRPFSLPFSFSKYSFISRFKMSLLDVVHIDGSIKEGGGQILRMAVSLSAILKKPIKVYNIRAGRSSPGLRPQHLAGLQLIRDICGGTLKGGFIGSTEITFFPSSIKSGIYTADPGTAGSVMLLFQVAFPCLLFADGVSELHLKGGTNAAMAPQIDHTLMVFKPIAEKLGMKFDCNIIRRGYYPKGGGEVMIKISPVDDFVKPIVVMDPGHVIEIVGRSFVAGIVQVKVAHGMADAATRLLRRSFANSTQKIECLKETPQDAYGNGGGIVIVARTSTGCLLGGSALEKKGTSVEDVGLEAANQIIEDVNNGACVDRFMQDQLIIFMTLAKGESKIRCGNITLHTETAIHIAEKLTEVSFIIQRDGAEDWSIIECDGIGFQRH